ncbi:MAG: hypothetical protein ACEPOZ_21640 [Marinifilaceae bacterium]
MYHPKTKLSLPNSKTLILLICFLGNCISLIAQEKKNYEYEFTRTILQPDTIKKEEGKNYIRINWLDTAIVVNHHPHSEQADTEFIKKRELKRGIKLSPKAEKKFRELQSTFTQNCHSYALEKCFRQYQIDPQYVFTSNTWIDTPSLELILSTTFTPIDTLYTRKKKNLKKDIGNGHIAVFHNQSDMMIHTIFKDKQGYRTKNGGFKQEICSSMKEIFKSYWDTKFIVIYKFRDKRVKQFAKYNRKTVQLDCL